MQLRAMPAGLGMPGVPPLRPVPRVGKLPDEAAGKFLDELTW